MRRLRVPCASADCAPAASVVAMNPRRVSMVVLPRVACMMEILCRMERHAMLSKSFQWILAVGLSFCAAPSAQAAWPERAIKWIVPFGPGGANDLIARAAADGVSKRLGQPIIIENRPGAGAIVGTAAVAKAAPDGYTFLIGGQGVITNTLLLKNLPYADAELTPVGMIAVAPSIIVVHPGVPATDMTTFATWARQQGDKGVTWSTAGSGST